MVVDADSSGVDSTSSNDLRITPIGSTIRNYKIDEIPQFFNVLKGDMSLIGPRPERPFFTEQYTKQIPYFNLRHVVKGGITGWAQIKHSYDSSLSDVREKLKYDFFYIENISLSLDFLIMFRTVLVMLSGVCLDRALFLH